MGARDHLLLRARRSVFGSQLQAIASCPTCGRERGFDLDIDQDLLPLADGAAKVSQTLRTGRWRVDLRPLDSRDQLELQKAGQITTDAILGRAVVSARHGRRDVPVEDLPADVRHSIGEHLDALDPLALVPLSLDCAACGASWFEIFDVGEFWLRELEQLATRLLGEVERLARTFGWSEKDVLEMSGQRRRFYLHRAPDMLHDEATIP